MFCKNLTDQMNNRKHERKLARKRRREELRKLKKRLIFWCHWGYVVPPTSKRGCRVTEDRCKSEFQVKDYETWNMFHRVNQVIDT